MGKDQEQRDWQRQIDKAYSRPTVRARALRNNATDAEKHLSQYLSARKVAGVRFNRQYPVGQFICDFVSRERKLVIELDGGQHAINVEYDARRTGFLMAQGYSVIRFWNNDVLGNVNGVVAEIERFLANMPSPDPSRKREGSLWTSPRREDERQ